jgi:hypothetical protein
MSAVQAICWSGSGPKAREHFIDCAEAEMNECGAAPDDWRWLVYMAKRGSSWRLPYEPALCGQCGAKAHGGWSCLPAGYDREHTHTDEEC